jgi:hypothetical protein
MKKSFPLLVILAFQAFTFLPQTRGKETLILDESFDQFNLAIWKHEITMGGGGNWEFEHYTNNRSNSYVRDGILYLKPTLTAEKIGEQNVRAGYTMDIWGANPANLCTGNAFYGCSRTSGAGGNYLNPIQSAAIRTSESALLKYGRVEVKAKLPVGDWLWPAIWMLPRHEAYGTWPASGEIDIMESRGNLQYLAGGVESFGSTIHWGPFWPLDPWSTTHQSHSMTSGTFHDDFHVFGLYWDQTGLFTYLDNPSNRILSVNFTEASFFERGSWTKTNFDNPWAGRSNAAPFDQQFYLMINLAVGGTGGYFPDTPDKPWSNSDPHAVNQFYDKQSSWYPT